MTEFEEKALKEMRYTRIYTRAMLRLLGRMQQKMEEQECAAKQMQEKFMPNINSIMQAIQKGQGEAIEVFAPR